MENEMTSALQHALRDIWRAARAHGAGTAWPATARTELGQAILDGVKQMEAGDRKIVALQAMGFGYRKIAKVEGGSHESARRRHRTAIERLAAIIDVRYPPATQRTGA